MPRPGLVFTMHDEPAFAEQALAAGALGLRDQVVEPRGAARCRPRRARLPVAGHRRAVGAGAVRRPAGGDRRRCRRASSDLPPARRWAFGRRDPASGWRCRPDRSPTTAARSAPGFSVGSRAGLRASRDPAWADRGLKPFPGRGCSVRPALAQRNWPSKKNPVSVLVSGGWRRPPAHRPAHATAPCWRQPRRVRAGGDARRRQHLVPCVPKLQRGTGARSGRWPVWASAGACAGWRCAPRRMARSVARTRPPPASAPDLLAPGESPRWHRPRQRHAGLVRGAGGPGADPVRARTARDADGTPLRLLVRADPADELAEAWTDFSDFPTLAGFALLAGQCWSGATCSARRPVPVRDPRRPRCAHARRLRRLAPGGVQEPRPHRRDRRPSGRNARRRPCREPPPRRPRADRARGRTPAARARAARRAQPVAERDPGRRDADASPPPTRATSRSARAIGATTAGHPRLGARTDPPPASGRARRARPARSPRTAASPTGRCGTRRSRRFDWDQPARTSGLRHPRPTASCRRPTNVARHAAAGRVEPAGARPTPCASNSLTTAAAAIRRRRPTASACTASAMSARSPSAATRRSNRPRGQGLHASTCGCRSTAEPTCDRQAPLPPRPSRRSLSPMPPATSCRRRPHRAAPVPTALGHGAHPITARTESAPMPCPLPRTLAPYCTRRGPARIRHAPDEPRSADRTGAARQPHRFTASAATCR